MAVLIASALRKEFSGEPLFDGVSFKVERRDRLALAGPNGAGKTTLLRALIGETELAGGELAWEKGARVALHDQRPPRLGGFSLREYALSGAADLIEAERELRRLEEAMADGDHAPETLRRYGEAQARLEHAGGYGWRDHATSVLRGLGFADADLDRGLETFSGGELTRASLARALSGGPDLLLLDEPTNHLDMESMEWLEQELSTIDAAVILVAHDRWFLESVGTAVLELEGGKSTYFPGKWHVWRQEKAARLAAQAKFAERQAEDIARLDRFVARFRYGTKSRQAQAKLKQIARIEAERVEAPRTGRRTLGFEFLKPARSGRMVVEAEGFDLAAGSKRLLENAELVLERGEHVALIGPNGSGKSTLLEAIVGGRLGRIGHGVEVAYFSQHEVELDERGSVLECAMGATGLQRSQAQALLGRFLFSGWDDHDKPVVALSGGERRRLALALVVASGANFLVLDEPTNHLDLESREALEAALEAFPGTVLLVSHDRAVLDAVAERIVAVEDGRLRSYDGGWADYARDPRRRDGAAACAPQERKEKPSADEGEAAPERAGDGRGVDPGARARARRAGAAAGGRLGQRGGARGAHGRARGAAAAAAALGAAVRVRSGVSGEAVRDDRRVLTDADQERRLPLAQEVRAEEEQPGHGRALTVVMEREALRVERLRPGEPRRVVGAEAGCDDRGAEAAEVDGLGRRAVERLRLGKIGVDAVLPEELSQLQIPLVPPGDAVGHVGREAGHAVLDAHEVSDERHAQLAERAQMEVVAATAARRQHVRKEARLRPGQRVRRRVEEARLDEPPNEVTVADAPRQPRSAAAREHDLPAGVVQLLRDLAAGLAAPDDEDGACGEHRRRAVVVGRRACGRLSGSIAAAGGKCGRRVGAGRDDERVAGQVAGRRPENEAVVRPSTASTSTPSRTGASAA